MKIAEFRKVVEEFTDREEALLGWKRAEYARPDGDVLLNFKTVGVLADLPQEQVLALYLAKHIQAVVKQVMAGEYAWAWETEGGEGLKQRIADARNYLLLLAASIEESGQRPEGLPDVTGQAARTLVQMLENPALYINSQDDAVLDDFLAQLHGLKSLLGMVPDETG